MAGPTVTASIPTITEVTTTSVSGSADIVFDVSRNTNYHVTVYDGSNVAVATSHGKISGGTINLPFTQSSLVANTEYSYYSYGILDDYAISDTSTSVSAVTLAAPATVSLDSVDNNSATIAYSTAADGGHYDKTIEYSLDGGSTWATGDTVSGGSAATGTFTITGLLQGHNYTVLTRTTTTAGSNSGGSLSFTTTIPYGLYGSVNGVAKKITKLYGPAQRLNNLNVQYSGSGGYLGSLNTSAFLTRFMSNYPGYNWKTYGELVSVRLIYVSSSNFGLQITTTRETINIPNLNSSALQNWGVTLRYPNGYTVANLYPIYKVAARLIAKLYGSVNGARKRIY